MRVRAYEKGNLIRLGGLKKGKHICAALLLPLTARRLIEFILNPATNASSPLFLKATRSLATNLVTEFCWDLLPLDRFSFDHHRQSYPFPSSPQATRALPPKAFVSPSALRGDGYGLASVQWMLMRSRCPRI